MTKSNEVRKRGWYILQTAFNCEDRVKSNLEGKVKSLFMEDTIFDILVPKNDVEVIDKEGNKSIKQAIIYPSYVFVEMIPDEKTWFAVRNTQFVTGILGGGGKDPVPVSQAEMDKIFIKIGRKVNLFEEKDTVEILSGPFKDKTGTVVSVQKDEIVIGIDIFGDRTIEFTTSADNLRRI